jgi:predicted acetyltransferase
MEYRPITPDEFSAFIGVLSHTFAWDPKPEEIELEQKRFEFDRSIAAFDNGHLIGTGANLSFHMTVPGGSINVGGVTMIGVLPSHRRQGVLSSMMSGLLDDSRRREEAVSILWASESSIYGRFGYGVTTRHADRIVERAHATLRSEISAPGSVRLIDKDEALRLIPEVYEQVVGRYPGMIERTPEEWEISLADLESWRSGYTANRFALYEESGAARGYARYRVKEDWKDGHAQSTLDASSVIGVDDAAGMGLWKFLFGIDLVKTIRARHRPLRDPLEHMLTDPRRLSFSVVEGIWARILDVPVALEARRYAVEGSLTIGITGPEDVAGVYRLEGGPDGASCARTSGTPDLRMGISTLGMRYLGDHDFESLAGAGLVEGSREALHEADLLFGWHEPAWCVTGF